MRHKIIVVGCGSMANTWIKDAAERENAEILALVDIRKESAEAASARHGLNVPCYESLYDALDAHPDANLALDVTIPEAHEDTATLAMRRGLNVLSEKPMADSPEACERLVGVSRETGKTYAVMQNRRYDKRIIALRDMARNPLLGKGGFLCADFFLGPHFGGFRDLMESPLILDMSIHTFDQARFITGAKPVSVYCHEFNAAGSWYAGAASAVAIFEMDDGSTFCYRGSWSAEGLNTSWECEWRYQFEKGTLLWDGREAPRGEAVDASLPVEFMAKHIPLALPKESAAREFHAGCLDEMYAALERGEKPQTDCEDNLHSMRMVFGAMRSAREQKKIYF